MKILKIKKVKASQKLFKKLEKLGLIRLFKPTKKCFNIKQGSDYVETLYSSNPLYGSHKLICVSKNFTDIELTSHPDNEEFIIINSTDIKFKPLFLIIALKKHKELQNLINKNKLKRSHIIAIKLDYNNPKTSFFTLLKDTVHCEVTLKGKKQAPIFFVTEPTHLKMPYIKMNNYKIILE